MIEMARLGAGVMETTSVEIGYKNNISIHVASSSKDTEGTYITENYESSKLISGIAISDNTYIFRIKNISSKSNDISLISKILLDENLNIKMVSQMQDDGEYTNLSLVISKGDLGCIDEAINTIKVQLPHIEINNDIDITTISVIGRNINKDNILSNILEILQNNNIKLRHITISELSISFIVDIKDKYKFIELLGHKFDL